MRAKRDIGVCRIAGLQDCRIAGEEERGKEGERREQEERREEWREN